MKNYATVDIHCTVLEQAHPLDMYGVQHTILQTVEYFYMQKQFIVKYYLQNSDTCA